MKACPLPPPKAPPSGGLTWDDSRPTLTWEHRASGRNPHWGVPGHDILSSCPQASSQNLVRTGSDTRAAIEEAGLELGAGALYAQDPLTGPWKWGEAGGVEEEEEVDPAGSYGSAPLHPPFSKPLCIHH